MEALFGDMLARNEIETLQATFRTYETILSLVSIVLYSTTAVLIVPFVKLYTAGICDVNYVQPVFSILLVLTALSYCLRLPYHAIVIAAGHFKQTSAAAYGEALINIAFSVFLVSRYGLIGVAAATLLATWFRFIYYVFYLSRNIFHRKIGLFFKRLLINTAAIIANCFMGYGIVSVLGIASYISWAFCGVAVVMASAVSTFVINMCCYREDCIGFIKKFLK